jgi:hypothetical protein
MKKTSADVSAADHSVADVSVNVDKRPGYKSGRRPRARFSDDYELLLLQLIAARKSAGVTQKEIAVGMGKDRTHISKVEHRDRELNVVDMRLWCETLGLQMSDVIREWEKQLANSKPASAARSAKAEKGRVNR